MASAQDLSELENDPRLFLYTSLTAGSSHIITATSRLETILKANKIPFLAIDIATDQKARRLWQRRGQGKKLPGLVKEGFVLGDLQEIEDWNELGELKENIGPVPPGNAPASFVPSTSSQAAPAPLPIPIKPTATQGTANTSAATSKFPVALVDESKIRPISAEPPPTTLREALDPAHASPPQVKIHDAPKPETMNSSSAQKEASIHFADEMGSKDSTAAVAGQSTSANPDSSVAATAGSNTTHRGSDVIDAGKEKIKEVETENSIPEAAEESGTLNKGSEGVQDSEGPKTQEQDTKSAEDAGKSVED